MIRLWALATMILWAGTPAGKADPLSLVDLEGLASVSGPRKVFEGLGNRAILSENLRLWRFAGSALFLCDVGPYLARGTVIIDLIEAETNSAACENHQATPVAVTIASHEGYGAVCRRNGDLLAHFAGTIYAARLDLAMAPDHLPAVTCPEVLP